MDLLKKVVFAIPYLKQQKMLWRGVFAKKLLSRSETKRVGG